MNAVAASAAAPPTQAQAPERPAAIRMPLTRKEVVQAMLPFVTPDTRVGLKLFVRDYALFIAAMAAALLAEPPALRVAASVFAGVKLGGLYSLAHDAAHNGLTASRRLNKVLSVLAFLPVLHNWRLWIYDHHVLHHPRTNGPHADTFQPMCVKRYRAAPAWRRAWERFVRSPNPFAFATYYIVARWSQVKVVPTRSMPLQVRKGAWPHSALIAAYVGALVAGPALLRGGDGAAFFADVALLLVLPFFVFMTLLSTVLYIQHTHPQIPWFADGDAAIERFGQEALTVHVQVPRVLGALMHSSLEHAAHHVLPAIPCYRLRAAQARLTELLGAASHDVPLGLGALGDIVRRCKLYDYERHHWVDFAGRTTAETAAARPA